MASKSAPTLPTSLTSPSDVRRLRRELETLDDFLHQASLRQGGKPVKLPQVSGTLEELAATANVNLLQVQGRDQLLKYLGLLLKQAPVLHISFASEPSASFLQKLIVWLRANIHATVLVQTGVQPAITAGCIVRTANKQFDFSLRQSLDAQKGALTTALRGEAPA